MGNLADWDAGLWFSSWSVQKAQSQWPLRALLLGGSRTREQDQGAGTICAQEMAV